MAEADAVQPHGRTEDLEAALVRRLREGAPEAHAALYDRFAPGLHRFAASRLHGDAQLAEDIVVQTFVDAVRNISRFDPRQSTLAAWLYGIARRQVQMERRRQGRLKSVPAAAQVPVDTVSEVADERDLASDLAARLDAQRQVAALSRVLSDLEMEALVLQCVDRFSAREIGQVVGRSERAVHSLLHRARRKARERLAQDGD